MAFFPLGKKPPGELEINWSNPITRSLNLCILIQNPQGGTSFPGNRCMVNPARTVTVNGSLLSVKAGRFGAEYTGMASTAYLTISPTVAVSGGWSLSTITRFNAPNSDSIFCNNPSGAWNAHVLRRGSTNLASYDTTYRDFSPAINVGTENEYHNLTITGTSAGADAYVDLNPVPSTSAFNPSLAMSNFMADSSTGNRPWTTALCIMAWTRRLTAGEVVELHRNRWGLFRPVSQQPRRYTEQALAAFLARQGLAVQQAVNRASTF